MNIRNKSAIPPKRIKSIQESPIRNMTATATLRKKKNDRGETYIEISGVATNPALKRRGFQIRLFKRIIRTAKATGIKYLELKVESSAIGAIQLYKKLGFKIIGTTTHKQYAAHTMRLII